MSKLPADSKEKTLTEQEKLRYLQMKIHQTTIECLDSYILLKKKIPLIQASLAMVFMDFRNSVFNNVSMPYRYKSSQSVQKNIDSVFQKYLNLLPKDCTTADIDKMVENAMKDISKDFFGATFVLHNQNDVRNYCDDSDDIYVKKLYNQYVCVEKFLSECKKLNHLPVEERSSLNQKKIDITDTFIDEDANLTAPHQISPFSVEDIHTYRDYNTKLIELLTLSTNCSIPCTEARNGKSHKYAVSQKDISYLKLVEEAKLYNPENKDEWIKILTELAHKAYFEDYVPFDIQLENAINKNKELSYSSEYDKPLSEQERVHCINHLTLLKENLALISKDRLLNYILKKEMPHILNTLSDQPGIKIKVLDTKEKAKENGFYALYYIILINNIAILELQGQSEFRSDIAKEGNAAHNTIPGKSFDIRHMFDLNEETTHPFDPDQLDLYCSFLETVNLNDISTYNVSKEDEKNIAILQDLVEYASSKIKVKDNIPDTTAQSDKTLDFYSYIESLLDYYGPEFGSIVPAHRIEHNQALVVPQNKMYALENILKNRVGFSVLANLIRDKYKEETSKRGLEILPNDYSKAYSSTLMKYDLHRINEMLYDNIKAYEPFKDISFTPISGNKKQKDTSR